MIKAPDLAPTRVTKEGYSLAYKLVGKKCQLG